MQKTKKAKMQKYKKYKIAKTLKCQLLVQKSKRDQNIKRVKTAKKCTVPSIFHRIFR